MDSRRRRKTVIALQQLMPGQDPSCSASDGSVGMIADIVFAFTGARMPRQIDYYFSLPSPWAYIGHKTVPRRRRSLRSQGESQAGGAGRAVFGNRRAAADQAPSGAAALPHGRTAALARQARPEFPFSAEACAVQRAAGGRRGDRSRRGRARSRSVSAAAFARRSGRSSSIWPIPRPRQARRRSRPSRQRAGRAFGTEEIGAAYEQNRQDAIAADVFGSPVYVLDGEVFWGQDRIELLADALKSGRKRL